MQTQTGNRFMHMRRGEEGEGGMYGESNMEPYITVCKTNSQREFSVWLRELKLGLCNNLEWWDGEGGGGRFKRERTYVYLWQSHVDVWQKPTQHCKAIILQLKRNKFLKERKGAPISTQRGNRRRMEGRYQHQREDPWLPAAEAAVGSFPVSTSVCSDRFYSWIPLLSSSLHYPPPTTPPLIPLTLLPWVNIQENWCFTCIKWYSFGLVPTKITSSQSFYCGKIHIKIYHFNHFSVNSWVTLSTFTLYTHHHRVSPELFLLLQMKLSAKKTLTAPTLSNPYSIFGLSELYYSRYLI